MEKCGIISLCEVNGEWQKAVPSVLARIYQPDQTVSTVKIHVEHILAKLRVSDRTQAAVRAIELGLLQTTSKE
jgi:hypothetical protein